MLYIKDTNTNNKNDNNNSARLSAGLRATLRAVTHRHKGDVIDAERGSGTAPLF